MLCDFTNVRVFTKMRQDSKKSVSVDAMAIMVLGEVARISAAFMIAASFGSAFSVVFSLEILMKKDMLVDCF